MEEKAGFLDPEKAVFRFLILIFVAFLAYGSYFAYDSLGAIAPLLIEAFGIGREQIGFAYSAYSIAAIFSVFLGGILVDRIGTRKASLIFSTLIVAGAFVVAISQNIYILYIGRVIFGIGSESLVVCQSAILARWFRGKELALAFGISLTLSRLGTILSFNIEAGIAEKFGSFRSALWVALLLCILSLFSNLIYFFMDRYGSKFLNLREAGTEKIRLKKIGELPKSYWLIVMLCLTFYSAIFPFTSLSTDFFNTKWGIPLTIPPEDSGFINGFINFFRGIFKTAGGITSIIMIASAILAPVFGRMVDKIGRRVSILLLGSALMIPTYLIMGFTYIYPAFPMILLGISFSLVPSALWPSVPLIVKEEKVGTAFGLMTMIQNIGLFLFPYLNGKLRDITMGYRASMIMFTILGISGFIFAIFLKIYDSKTGNILERMKQK
ncbi:MAG: MFS transporter [Candidatus Aminicenantia bacterium]